jgi:hypothetical protein
MSTSMRWFLRLFVPLTVAWLCGTTGAGAAEPQADVDAPLVAAAAR